MAKKKKKVERVEMVIYGVLSYPDLANPKPFKGKIYYRTDVLLDKDDPQIAILQKKLKKVRIANWGEDKTEWPEKAAKRFIQDGDEREDQPAYEGKFYISVSTQTPVPCITPKGTTYNPAMVKGGMFAKVAVCISPWTDPDGEEGLSIYLQGVMIDTGKEKLAGFGGAKSAKQLFGLEESEEEESDDDDTPHGKKGKKSFMDDDHEDDSDGEESDDDDEDEVPKKKGKKPQNRHADM